MINIADPDPMASFQIDKIKCSLPVLQQGPCKTMPLLSIETRLNEICITLNSFNESQNHTKHKLLHKSCQYRKEMKIY